VREEYIKGKEEYDAPQTYCTRMYAQYKRKFKKTNLADIFQAIIL
jgi:hypothetical protein